MVTTYKLKDGSTRTLVNGNGGTSRETFILDEGVYLKSIKMSLGNHVDWIQFCDTNEYCSGKLGGSTDKDESQTIDWEGTVIKSLRGHAGLVIDRIMAYAEKPVDSVCPCTEILRSTSNTDCENFDHSEELGGHDQIDKITKIEVYTGPDQVIFPELALTVSPIVLCADKHIKSETN